MQWKRVTAAVAAVLASGAMLAGCNMMIVDTVYKYDYAYILLPDGTCVQGKVDKWTDYADGDQLQIVIEGVTYLTDTTRAVLVQY